MKKIRNVDYLPEKSRYSLFINVSLKPSLEFVIKKT